MNNILIKSALALIITSQITGCDNKTPKSDHDGTSQQTQSTQQPVEKAKTSGIQKQNFDTATSPKDDFYQYVNGAWLKNAEIPKDASSWGAFDEVTENLTHQLHDIVNELSTQKLPEGSTQKKVADLYKSYMDEKNIEALGVKPIKNELDNVNQLKSTQDLAKIFAHFSNIGISTPISLSVEQDMKNSQTLILNLSQSGLGLPDLENYLKNDSKNLKLRKSYLAYIKQILTMAGEKQAAEKAEDILKLETKLAAIQWNNLQNSDVEKQYNIYQIDDLPKVSKKFNWNAYLNELGVAGKISKLQLSQKSYFQKLDPILINTPLSTWQAYLKWNIVSTYTPLLTKDFVDAEQKYTNDTSIEPIEQEVRWKRGIDFVNTAMSQALGEMYVKKYFPPENKQHIEKLVQNILQVYDQNLSELEWMSPETKQAAHKKLSAMTIKVAYPKKWMDYSGLTIKDNDLVGNVMRTNQFLSQYQINKLGKPFDREEWGMPPQEINAFYNASSNEIVFPAAILQPPFFDKNTDDAVNYGAIGTVIGHEISHAFDDNGSKFDELGNMKNWWTEADFEHFQKNAKLMVKQYNAYKILSTHHVDGELTLGENIADNLGLSIAYKAYIKSLNGKPAPKLDGFTGPQRFYIGFAQVSRSKAREDDVLDSLNNDSHAPFKVRVNAVVANQQSFYDAFAVKQGDKMYLSPEKRISIW